MLSIRAQRKPVTVSGNSMATVQILTDSAKNERQNNFGKAVRLSFAKAKEKQRHPKANPQLLQIQHLNV